MLLRFFKIAAISIVIFAYILSKSNCKSQNLGSAKRSLIEREKEYFRKQPMSEELRDFIKKYRNRRRKRNGDMINEDVLYVVQDGQLVPLKNLKNYNKRSEDIEDKNGFTVVPLVIPINTKLQGSKLLKIRDLNEQSALAQSSTGAVSTSTTPTIDNKTLENPGDEDDNNRTQEETKVLHKILEDVEGLMQYRSEGNKKEGLLCNLNGSWISDAAGMRFDICYKPETRKKFRIHVADRIPPNEDGFLCDGNWSVFGEIPFQHSGVVIALAVHEKDKHIATFIGECRVCEGSETVTGTWLLGRSSRDCKDQKASHKILSDVWKREQTHSLQKKHLRELGMPVSDED